MGKVLLLPCGIKAQATSDQAIEKEIVRCLQISDGAARDEVGGEMNERSRIRHVSSLLYIATKLLQVDVHCRARKHLLAKQAWNKYLVYDRNAESFKLTSHIAACEF